MWRYVIKLLSVVNGIGVVYLFLFSFVFLKIKIRFLLIYSKVSEEGEEGVIFFFVVKFREFVFCFFCICWSFISGRCVVVFYVILGNFGVRSDLLKYILSFFLNFVEGYFKWVMVGCSCEY